MGTRGDAHPDSATTMVYPAGGGLSHADLRRLFPAPGHRHRASPSELDTGREIPLSEVCRRPRMRFLCSRARCCRPYRPRDFHRRKLWPPCRERGWSRKTACVPVPIHRSMHSRKWPRSATFTEFPCRDCLARSVAIKVLGLVGGARHRQNGTVRPAIHYKRRNG